MRRGFTMIELVFVIVVVGILAGIAIPKFAATRDDAIITKARATVGAVRSALAAERQKKILRGETNTTIAAIRSTDLAVKFGSDTSYTKLLEYPIKKCKNNADRSCWQVNSNKGWVIFHGPDGNKCRFQLDNKGHLNVVKNKCDIPNLSNL